MDLFPVCSHPKAFFRQHRTFIDTLNVVIFDVERQQGLCVLMNENDFE